MHIRNTNEDGDPEQSEPEICYKIVLKHRSYLVSVMHTIDFPTVYYAPLQRSVAKIGKLFVFKDLNRATFWWNNNSPNEEVWLAHGENLEPILKVLPWAKVYEHYEDFWHTFKDKRMSIKAFHNELADYDAPSGTYISDSVTLVKRLKPDD